jgi:hypothetical protein
MVRIYELNEFSRPPGLGEAQEGRVGRAGTRARFDVHCCAELVHNK